MAATPVAAGMGVPGLVDRDQGITLFLPNLPTQWRGVAVARMLGDCIGYPVYLLNDARIATLGEMSYGLGRNGGTMVFLSLGTGIGGGVVIDGKLRLGPLGAAGELGHQTILPDGPLCGCGNHGCLETLASGPAIGAEGSGCCVVAWLPASTTWWAATRKKLLPARCRPRRRRVTSRSGTSSCARRAISASGSRTS